MNRTTVKRSEIRAEVLGIKYQELYGCNPSTYFERTYRRAYFEVIL